MYRPELHIWRLKCIFKQLSCTTIILQRPCTMETEKFMNSKELIVGLLVLSGLCLTFLSFSHEDAYDCFQFNHTSSSTCSISGGKCVKLVDKRGFSGVAESVKEAGTMVDVKCRMFGCAVEITPESQVPTRAHQ